MCMGCNNMMLKELEEKETNQRNNFVAVASEMKRDWKLGMDAPKHLTRGSGIQGVIDCCPHHKQDIWSLELDNNQGWYTQKNIANTERFLPIKRET